MTEILTTEKRSEADAKALLLNEGLIVSETAEATATNVVSAAKLEELVRTEKLTVEEAELLASKAGVTLANYKEASSFSALSTSVKNVGNSLLALVKAHPILAVVTVAITAVTTAITIAEKKNEEYIESQKELIEKTDENISKYDDEISSLDNLQKALHDAKGDKEKLASIQGELNKTIGDTPGLLNAESEAYNVANQKIDDRIKRLKELRKLELEDKVTAQKEIFNNSTVNNAWGIDRKFDTFSNHKMNVDRMVGYDSQPFTSYVDKDISSGATAIEVFKNLKKNSYGEDEDERKSNAEIWKELIDSFDGTTDGAWLEVEEIQKFFDNQTEYAQKILSEYINNSESIFSKEELNNVIKNLVESGYAQDLEGIENVVTSLVENDELETAINDYYESLYNNDVDSDALYKNVKQQFDVLTNKYPELKEILDNFFNNIGKDISTGANTVSVTNPISFTDTLNSADYAEIKDELLELAKSGEITPETLSSTEEYANLLKSTDTSAESAMNQILDLLTAQEKLAGFSQGLDKLKSAYEEFKDEDIGFVTAETLQSLPDSFKKLPEFDLFSQIVGDPTSGAEAIQQAFNDIVKAYMLSQDVLQGLVNASEHDIQSYIANFKQLGVTNAEEVVNLAVEALNSENELLNSAEAEYIDYLNNKDDYDTDYLESVASKNGQLASALGEAYKADYDNWCELLHNKAEAYNQFIKALEESGIVYDSSKSIQENAQNAIKKEGYSPSEIDRINRAASNAELSSYLADKQKQALKLDLSQITTDFGTKYSPSTSSGSKDGSKDTINTETYDHIERKLEVIAKKTEKAGEAFEKAFSLNATNIRYKEYLSQIDEEISANNTAIQTYQAKLNSIGLSADWIAKIQNGEYSITDVTDDALNERIGLYQEYYDKLESCQETVEELEKKRLEAQNQYAEKIVEIYDREIEKIDKLIDRRESLIELKEKFGGSASASDLKYEQKKYSQQITIYDKQIDKLKELQKTVAVGSDAWKTYKEQIEANKESVLDITNSIADLAEQLASLPLEKYEKFLEKNDAKNEYYTSKYNNVVSTASKGKLLTNQIDALTAKNDKTQSYATTAKKNFNNSKTSVDKAYNSDMNNKNTTDEEKSVLTEYRNKVKNYTKNNKKIPASLITKIGKDGFGEFHKACINYNEMLEAKDAAVETAKLTAEQTRTEIRELAEQKYNLPIEKYDEGVEKNDKKNALYEAQLSNKTSASSKNKVINKQIKLEENNLAKAQNAVKETSKNVTSSISDIKTAKTQESKGKTKTEKSKINKLYTQVSKYTKSKKAIPNDLITKIGKAGLTSLQTACDEYNAALAANQTATDTAKVVAEQTKSNVNELKKQQFDNIQEKYSRKASQTQAKANNVDSRIALLEAKGYQSSASWYNELIAYEKQNLANSQAELKALKAKQNEMTKYTDEWWEAEDAINSVTQAVNDSTLALQEFLNTQREINFENFEFLQGQISRLSEEAQYFIDLMQNKEMTGDNGLTNYGLTAMGLYYQQIETGLNQAQDYAKKIAEIDQELLKEPYDTELLTQKQEYIDAQRDIMTNNESLKKSIADLVKDGYDSLLDSLGEVIDKYKEVLQNAKDAHDYQKNISDKTENINTLQKQITAYASMTGNDEVASKLQSLQAEYKDAQEDLQETLYDKYISDTEEILDEMLDELETFIEELSKNIEELYKIGVEQITNGVGDISTTLLTLSNNANTPMSNEMTIVWEDNSLMTNLTTAIEEATKVIKATIDEQSDASAFEVFSSKYDKTDYDSQIATAKRDWDSARLRISEYGGITDEEPYLDIKNSLEKDNADMQAEIKLLESKIAKTKNKAKIAEFNQRINDLISKIASNNAEIKTNDLELEKVRELNDGLENATIAYINAVNAKTSAMDNNKAVIKELLSAIANDYPTGLSDEQTELDKKVSDILGMTSYLSKANISQLAELFGVRDNEFFVLQALKNAGFATGGIVKAVGEDGIGLVRNGEGFVMPEVVPIMQDILGAMPKIDTFIDTTLSNLPSNRGNIEQTIEFGDIYMSGVNDPQEFSKQLISTFQNEAKVQKMFGTFVNNSLTGKNSLSIRKY